MLRLIRSVIFLYLILCLSTALWASRGIQIKTKQGREVGTYKGSYALLIGVSDYSGGWPDLEQIPSELNLVEKALRAQGFEVKKTINPNAEELQKVIEDFIDQYGYTKNNRLLFYYAGHGHTMNNGRKGFLVPTDAPDPRINAVGFKRKALDMNLILAWCRQMDAKHALFLFDSCFSGTIFKQRDLPEQPPHITQLTTKPVRQFITAGSAGEPVPAKSTFTPAFVDAIQHGLGDLNHDGYVSGTELGLYLQGVVPKYSRQSPQYGKIRDYELSRGDFVFQLASPEEVVEQPVVPLTVRWAEFSVLCNVDGARVLLDGEYIGKTPIKAHKVKWGRYRIEVEKAGYETHRDTFHVLGGDFTLEVMLKEVEFKFSHLYVDTEPPDATVRILNIKPRFSQGMRLKPGSYHLKVTADKHTPWKEWITLKPGEERWVEVILEQREKTPEPVTRDDRYIADANGIVRDTKTGLEWRVGPDKDTRWADAKSWVEGLKLNGGDWRMPTIDELKSLYDKGTGDHNMTPLLKTSGRWVWSADKTDGSRDALGFSFYHGHWSWRPRNISNGARAFAVRSKSDR